MTSVFNQLLRGRPEIELMFQKLTYSSARKDMWPCWSIKGALRLWLMFRETKRNEKKGDRKHYSYHCLLHNSLGHTDTLPPCAPGLMYFMKLQFFRITSRLSKSAGFWDLPVKTCYIYVLGKTSFTPTTPQFQWLNQIVTHFSSHNAVWVSGGQSSLFHLVIQGPRFPI